MKGNAAFEDWINMNRIIIVISTLVVAHAQDRLPLGEFRSRFVNQRIVVNQNCTSTPSHFLADWKWAKGKNGVFTTDYSRSVFSSLVGHTGVIVAVNAPTTYPPRKSSPQTGQANETYVQWGEAIVKLDSGELLVTTVYTWTTGSQAHDAFTLLSVRDRHKQETVSLARTMHGKALYLTRLTHVYDMGLSSSTIQTFKEGIGQSEAEIFDVPLLTPISILETRYSEPLDLSMIVLQLPNGRKGLYVLGCVIPNALPIEKYNCAATAMPTFLTDREIDAIRSGSVFVGMSMRALHMTIGFPAETKESLAGLTELTYRKHTVYMRNGLVAEVREK